MVSIQNPAFKTARLRVRRYGLYCNRLAAAPTRPTTSSKDREQWEYVFRLGIEAFNWLEQLKSGWVRELSENRGDKFDETYEALAELYRRWLIPCNDVIKWAEARLQKHIDFANYATLKRCCNRAVAFLDAVEMEAYQDEAELSEENSAALHELMRSEVLSTA